MATDSTSLPAGWTEGQNKEGRVFYVNHAEKRTTWERPTEQASAPPPPPAYAEVPKQQSEPRPSSSQTQDTPSRGMSCTARLVFWITVGMSSIVWLFSLAAASDKSWLEDLKPNRGQSSSSMNNGDFGVASDYYLKLCDINEEEDLCSLYKAFSSMQIIATIFCSAAVVVLFATFFLPARQGACSVIMLGRVGAGLMFTFSFFQLLACFIVIGIEKELDPGFNYGVDLGDTFSVAIFGCILGTATGVVLCMYAGRSGDGLLRKGA